VKKMALNFKIVINRTNDNLHIHLMGDFDGSSAWELINAISENLNNSKFIQIDTGKLKKVYPFGWEVFYNNFLKIKNQQIRIRFVGPNALHIAPT
jgi:anti-anti-sigma regulatory factor